MNQPRITLISLASAALLAFSPLAHALRAVVIDDAASAAKQEKKAATGDKAGKPASEGGASSSGTGKPNKPAAPAGGVPKS